MKRAVILLILGAITLSTLSSCVSSSLAYTTAYRKAAANSGVGNGSSMESDGSY